MSHVSRACTWSRAGGECSPVCEQHKCMRLEAHAGALLRIACCIGGTVLALRYHELGDAVLKACLQLCCRAAVLRMWCRQHLLHQRVQQGPGRLGCGVRSSNAIERTLHVLHATV